MEEEVSIEGSIKLILQIVVLIVGIYLVYQFATPSVNLDCGTDTDCWNNVTSELIQEMNEDLEDGVLDGSYYYDYEQITDKVEKIANEEIRYIIKRNITKELQAIEPVKQDAIMKELRLQWN